MMLCFIVQTLSFFFFKQKTAYEMRISDWSSDVCSSDLDTAGVDALGQIAGIGGGNDAADRVLEQGFLLQPFGLAGLALALDLRLQLFGFLALFLEGLHGARHVADLVGALDALDLGIPVLVGQPAHGDRKSTRLNSSH